MPTRTPTKRYVSHPRKDRIVHIHSPRHKKPHPLCHPTNWQEQVWRFDPADGIGADICQRCEIVWAADRERVYQNLLAKNRRYHDKHKDRINEYKRSYDKTSAARKARKVYYQRRKRLKVKRERENAKRLRTQSGDDSPAQTA